MIRFIREAVRELRHVVWPTRKETQHFFVITLIILTLFGTYLFIFSNIFSSIVFGLKDMFGISTGPTTQNSSLSEEEINELFSDEVDIDMQTKEGTGSVQVSNSGSIGEEGLNNSGSTSLQNDGMINPAE